jgi:hemolysin D
MRLLRANKAARKEPASEQLIALFRSETAEIEHASPPTVARMAVLWLAACFACMIGVSLLMPMDRVVTSEMGRIVTTRPPIVLQALDPSIIRSIDVEQGEPVKKGQLLATLDPTFAAADVGALKMKIASLDAEIARCQAELAHQPFVPPKVVLPEADIYGRLQQAYYDQRQAQFDAQVQNYDQQAAALRASIAKYQIDQQRLAERAKIAQQIEQMRATLAASEVGSKLNLLIATDQKVEIERNLQLDNGILVESQHKLDSVIAQRNAYVQDWMGQTSQELVKARNDRDEADESLSKAEKHQALVRLTAPEDAIVLDLTKLSVDSVVRGGQVLIALAPLHSPMQAEVHIGPKSIGFIRAGDPAKIKFTAFDYQQHGEAEGQVSWISEGTFNTNGGEGTVPTDQSADSTEGTNVAADGTQGNRPPYYLARIALTKVALRDVPGSFRLLPGMMLTADIKVGTRSVFMYLFARLLGVDEAMREP